MDFQLFIKSKLLKYSSIFLFYNLYVLDLFCYEMLKFQQLKLYPVQRLHVTRLIAFLNKHFRQQFKKRHRTTMEMKRSTKLNKMVKNRMKIGFQVIKMLKEKCINLG